VIRLGDAGAQLLDVRDAAEFAQGHVVGSINIGLGGQYATWAGTLLDRVRPIVIIAEPGREQEAALRLGRIGFDQLGYPDGGMAALAGRPDLVWPTERVSAATIAEELEGGAPPLVLDIRNPREWKAKHIQESLNIPLNHMQERIAEVPSHRCALRGRLPFLDCRRYSAPILNYQPDRDGGRTRRLGRRQTSGCFGDLTLQPSHRCGPARKL
jgi:hydroxyacylglutathione hydrolase